jgi:hypothetical protein
MDIHGEMGVALPAYAGGRRRAKSMRRGVLPDVRPGGVGVQDFAFSPENDDLDLDPERDGGIFAV